jgi:hypothetical protein
LPLRRACFAPWWQWQQRRLAQREAQLWAEYKAMAAAKLGEEGIRRESLGGGPLAGDDDGGGGGGSGGGTEAPASAYVLACPACRADITPASLAHAWPQLQAASAESWSGSGGGGGAMAGLPTQQRDALRAMQAQHAAVKRRQQACGGLVDASHSVSLADLQQAAAAAAAAEREAAAAATQGPANGAAPAPQSGGTNGPGLRHGGGRVHGGDRGGRGRQGGRGRGSRGRGGQHAAATGAMPVAKTSASVAAKALGGLKLAEQQGQQQQQRQRQHPQGSAGRGRGRGRPVPAAAAPALG